VSDYGSFLPGLGRIKPTPPVVEPDDASPLASSITIGSDAFSPYEPVLETAGLGDPWAHQRGEAPRYVPDEALLGRLLSVPVSTGERSESGRFAKGIDIWLAHELRRAGFDADEVWPRATRPRVLPRDIAMLLERLPKHLAAQVRERLPTIGAVGPVDAKVLGRAYEKQVDVCLSRWDRGPELLISTKAQLSSFGKNLPNRFEEAYGDAGNLRARYPLASVGFCFVQRATVIDREPEAFERTVDMMRKLRDIGAGSGYTTTGLLLVDWAEPPGPQTLVRVIDGVVPDDVGAPQFLTALIDRVLEVTPIQYHVDVRRRRERRTIPSFRRD
jgi:hypothetical protein